MGELEKMNKEKLYISGLPENSGPGNLLGAIAGEAGVDGGKVGNIEIKGSVATVDISGDIKDIVIQELDNVSGNPVQVSDACDPRSHFLELALLVEIEREEEMERHEREMRTMSGRERESEGRAILHLRGRDEGTALGGKHMVKFMRQRQGEPLPDTEIGVGDLVMLSKNNPLNDDNPTGTVAEKTNYSVTAAFDMKPPGFVYGKGLRCDLYVNDITYQRQLKALNRVYGTSDAELRSLAQTALGEGDIEFGEVEGRVEFLNGELNNSQREAVKRALSARQFFLIHGPPGTGKTVTSVEVARQLVRRRENVLCTADSNTAVDNLVERLAEAGEKVLRVGHPARVTPALRRHTLDEMIQQNEKYRESMELREKAMDLLDEQDRYTHPGGRWRRGMSDGQIKSLAEKGKGSRGVPSSKIKEMAKWLELQDTIDDMFQKVERLEQEAIDEMIEWADVVCSTNSGCGSEIMSGREFDTVVIDEATQATEPSCWIPITTTSKVVMAGDHKQLPPTILSEKAQELNRTLFERLVNAYGEEIRSVLKVQYRMHEDIMNFSNREFYDGVLEADGSVAHHTLDCLMHSTLDSGTIDEALRPETPVIFVDTADIDAQERTRPGSTSKENPKECRIVEATVSRLLELGVQPEDIAVISPYDDQVDLLRREIGEEHLEVDTVDGFQGREKEVIVLSLVRSNDRNNIGFLEDVRRLNVSLTRARRKLVIVGDGDTITTHPTYSRLRDYVRENGEIVEATDLS